MLSFIARLNRDIEHNSVDHRRRRRHFPIDVFFRCHHFVGQFNQVLQFSGLEIVVQIVFDRVDREVHFEIAQNLRFFHVFESVNFEVLREWIGRDVVFGESGEDHVSQLDQVRWEGIYKVEVELTKEILVVFEQHEDNSEGCGVIRLESLRNRFSWDHVVFQESETLDQKFLEFEPALVLSILLSLTTLSVFFIAVFKR